MVVVFNVLINLYRKTKTYRKRSKEKQRTIERDTSHFLYIRTATDCIFMTLQPICDVLELNTAGLRQSHQSAVS